MVKWKQLCCEWRWGLVGATQALPPGGRRGGREVRRHCRAWIDFADGGCRCAVAFCKDPCVRRRAWIEPNRRSADRSFRTASQPLRPCQRLGAGAGLEACPILHGDSWNAGGGKGCNHKWKDNPRKSHPPAPPQPAASRQFLGALRLFKLFPLPPTKAWQQPGNNKDPADCNR